MIGEAMPAPETVTRNWEVNAWIIFSEPSVDPLADVDAVLGGSERMSEAL
jgi:hypothetical protein